MYLDSVGGEDGGGATHRLHVRRSREYDLPVDRIRLLVLDELAIVEWERDLLLRDRSDTRVDVLSQGMSERSERGLR